MVSTLHRRIQLPNRVRRCLFRGHPFIEFSVIECNQVLQETSQKKRQKEQFPTLRTTCAYCGVGCGIEASMIDRDARRISIQGDPKHPANLGRLCSKGAALAETLGLEERLLYPEVNGQRVDWPQAIATVANRFREIIDTHGPDSVAFYVSGQLLTEDYYIANKLMKGFIGSGNIDTNSRLCMASTSVGHKRAFGYDVMPGTYEDLDHAKLIVFAGSNAAWCHPVLYQRIVKAKEENPFLKVVVIDPRETDTCAIADLHLAVRSGTDSMLFNGLLSYLQRQNKLDQNFLSAHVDGAEAALHSAQETAPSERAVAEACSLPQQHVERFYSWFAATEQTLTLFSQGINQSSSGSDKVSAIINCHLATGKIGKPGAGPFSLTGQPNAMGGREAGGLANLLAAHMEFGEREIDRVSRFWQSDRIARKPGLKAVSLFDEIHLGNVKAVWVMATSPVNSLPNASKVKEALEGCEFVVVSDITAHTDTNLYADVRLPALGWGEKSGTVTNSERRISRQRALLPPPGEARPDWWIICEVAKAMGFRKGFDFENPAQIFDEHARLSAFENSAELGLRDFDLSGLVGMSPDQYDNLVPIQWPVTPSSPQGTARVFASQKYYMASGRARMIPITPQPPRAALSENYPLVMATGRVRDQWHTMTRTALSPRLNAHKPEPYAEIHPEDAYAAGIKDKDLVSVTSRYGSLVVRAEVSTHQKPGHIFCPFHWTEKFALNGIANELVNPHLDPDSGQPESKHTPVALALFQASHYGFIFSRNAITPPVAGYRVLIPGREFLRYELAWVKAQPVSRVWALDILGDVPEQAEWIEYQDRSQGLYRLACIVDGRLHSCLFLGSKVNLPERNWLAGLFEQPVLSDQERQALLSGRPPAGSRDCGQTVCACFGVGEKVITEAIKKSGLTSVQEVGKHLQAGTNCGSCIPQIKGLLATAI